MTSSTRCRAPAARGTPATSDPDQANKAQILRDLIDHSYDTRARILAAETPAEAKDLGRTVRGFDSEVWTRARRDFVFRGNLAKFGQNSELGCFLRDTAMHVLVEASSVGLIWGVGLAQDDPRAGDPMRWRGLDLLGFVLMEVRSALVRESATRPGSAAGRHR